MLGFSATAQRVGRGEVKGRKRGFPCFLVTYLADVESESTCEPLVWDSALALPGLGFYTKNHGRGRALNLSRLVSMPRGHAPSPLSSAEAAGRALSLLPLWSACPHWPPPCLPGMGNLASPDTVRFCDGIARPKTASCAYPSLSWM